MKWPIVVLLTIVAAVTGVPRDAWAWGDQGHKVICEISRLYLANNSGTDVSVVDTATYALIGTVLLGGSPFLLGICSNGNALLGAGGTFAAGTGGALACTQASGPTCCRRRYELRSGRPLELGSADC